jgi:hypothetical protein
MLEYYDAHASDYDRVYSGEFPGSELVGSDAYPQDAQTLHEVVRSISTGVLLDAPCGTAFWLPAYASSVSRATLFDQSDRMLVRARSRATALGVDSNCTFAQGDALTQSWPPLSFDTVLVAFFLSHTDLADEKLFFELIRPALKRSGRVIVLDSIWNAERERSKRKEAVIQRSSTDGRRFDVYKRYLDAQDVSEMAARHGFQAAVLHAGRAFIAATMTLLD